MQTSKFKIWLSAARPQTLSAAFVPILLGASLAWNHGLFRWDTSAVALLCAFLIQIGTNFANDYYDYLKGADAVGRVGFTRATTAGLITPDSMFRATILTMALAFCFGLYLVWAGGWVILAIGLLSILFGILYTGGPFPLGYNGLGDLFVFIFFGIVAVMGTYYVNAFEWNTGAFIASLPAGALSVNILVVNNLRDVDQDRISGKRTLGVLLGEKALKMEYTLLSALAYLTPAWIWLFSGGSAIILLPLITIPLSWRLNRQIWTHVEKKGLNRTLEKSAQFMVVFGVLFAIGLILM